MTFSTLKDTKHQKRTMLLYGASGVGKTTAIADLEGLPSIGRILIVDFDGGTASIRDKHPNIMVTDPPVLTMQQGEDVVRKLSKREGIPDDVQTVVFDTVSRFESMIRAMVAKGATDSMTQVPEMSIRTWGDRTNVMVRQMARFIALPFRNVVFTAWMAEKKNDAGQVLQVGPQLPESLWDSAMGPIDHVFAMKIGIGAKGEREIYLDRTPQIAVRTRAPHIVKEFGQKTTKSLRDIVAFMDQNET